MSFNERTSNHEQFVNKENQEIKVLGSKRKRVQAGYAGFTKGYAREEIQEMSLDSILSDKRTKSMMGGENHDTIVIKDKKSAISNRGKRKLTAEEVYSQDMVNKDAAKKRNRPSEKIVLTPANELRNGLAGGATEKYMIGRLRALNENKLSEAIGDPEISATFREKMKDIHKMREQIALDNILYVAEDLDKAFNAYLNLRTNYPNLTDKEKHYCNYAGIK